MAALTSPHWEATLPRIRDLLKAIATLPSIDRFYLAGGTALALRIGHRVSRDLDFFSETDQVGDATGVEMLENLRRTFGAVETVTNAPGDLTIITGEVRTGFYSYDFRLLESTDELLQLRIASLVDIAAMKLDAIAGRGSRRDFYDVYFLAQHIPLDQQLERARTKYPHARDFPMTVMPYLNDFSNADRDRAVEALLPASWETVKEFFLAEARRLAREWYLPPEGE